MSYRVVLSETAESKLESLPPIIHSIALENLARLAESPTTLSRPSRPPGEIPGHQVFSFPAVADGHDYLIVAYLEYFSDEETLGIVDFGIASYA